MFFRKKSIFILLMFLSPQVSAGIFAQAGLHFGGDSLASVAFVGGNNESVEAGGLISASLGYESNISETLLMKFSAGAKLDSVTATNGDVEFVRFPINAMLFIKGEAFHFGAGITQHTGVELTSSGFGSFPTVEFEDATGLILQLDYILGERAYMSLKYTAINYQPVNSNIDVDGNSLGILIGYRFGK